MREYNCPKCMTPLIEGLEYQFPPRLSYWYCSKCQHIFRETGQSTVIFHSHIEGNERLCVQINCVRGSIENTLTGEKMYPDDLPDLVRKWE